MKKKLLSSDETYLRLARTEEFQRFFKGFIEFLKRKLQKIDVGESEPYFICGETHDLKLLWIYTDTMGLDFYAVKDLLDNFFFKELKCECEILGGHKEVRRRELEQFGVYFGEPGRREVDVV